MNLVLVCPEIAGNTGNIARLCAATRTPLHLIEPLGFRIDDRELARAGMDYWRLVEWHRWANWPAFCAAQSAAARFWFIEQGGQKSYHEVSYGPDDYLVLGRETAGLPKLLLESHPDQWLHIPMSNPEARSLNLANCAALVLFEALRQNGFPGC
jgi:tRNA (cytidine/uridine-2'-O-)-methyltransferase